MYTHSLPEGLQRIFSWPPWPDCSQFSCQPQRGHLDSHPPAAHRVLSEPLPVRVGGVCVWVGVRHHCEEGHSQNQTFIQLRSSIAATPTKSTQYTYTSVHVYTCSTTVSCTYRIGSACVVSSYVHTSASLSSPTHLCYPRSHEPTANHSHPLNGSHCCSTPAELPGPSDRASC